MPTVSPGAWPARLGGLEDEPGSRPRCGSEVRREAALVADGRREAPRRAAALFSAWKTSAPDLQRLGERRRAVRHDHELLQVERVVGVRAAVDDVHHRHRQRARAAAADVAVELQPELVGGRLRARRARRRGWRSRPAGPCSAVPSSSISTASIARWSSTPMPSSRGTISRITLRDGARDALAAERRPAVAQLDRLVHAGRRARGHGRPAHARRSRACTSTSTVGLPRESRIWRAWTASIVLMRALPAMEDGIWLA